MSKNVIIFFLSLFLLCFIVRHNMDCAEIKQMEQQIVDLRNEGSYEEGYSDGEKYAYDNGYDNGHIDGLAEGKEEGYYDGLAAGAELFCNYLRNETGVFYPLEERILSLQWYFDGEAPLSEAEEAFRELTDFCLKYDWAENCCSMGDAEFLYPADQSTEP